jgi:Xaa-Pro aminopeptidase
MLNLKRQTQYLRLMEASGWDWLMLYGQSWRKDYFRSLLNFSFFGPYAVAALSRTGALTVTVSHPWDLELLAAEIDAPIEYAPDFARGIDRLASGLAGATVAVAGMELMEAGFVNLTQERLAVTPVSATAAVEALRRAKTAEEIACVRQAAGLADAGYRHFLEVIEPGMAEYELVAEVEAFLKTNGAEDNFMLIGSGTTEVFGMKPPTERRFQPGDNVTTELSPQVNGYYAQICRTLVMGEPGPEQQRSFAIFREAQQAAEDYLRPGVNISDVARVQNDVFRRAGFGEYTGPQYTRVRGHNLGLHPDEHPYVLEDVDCIVNENMVVIAHPNTYLPLSGYMVFGDTLLVTGDGCERLGRTEKILFSKGS